MSHWRRCAVGITVALLGLSRAAQGQPQAGRASDLGDLSLEQLSSIVVSTVSGRAEPLSRAMASVYVITSDDIRRSGANSLPEALRLAPNLQVARAGASGYAITARGFNGIFANKLLVLIDGRSIYTPIFSGVFWDAIDIMLEDIDRIEVISGPGGVLWGANAVNGVINILTKSAADTRGGLVSAGAGNTDARVNVRYGGATGHYRAYVQATRRDDTEQPDGTENSDGSDFVQAGFHTDWTTGANAWTVQGDAYTSENNQEPEAQTLRGINVLGRFNRDFGDGGGLRVQAYYDATTRQQQQLGTFDVEIAHALRPHGPHTLLWGAGFRQAHDRIDNSAAIAFLPADKTLTSWDLYLQDVIALRHDLDMTIGARVDRNTYTGVEVLPSVRIGWRVRECLLWAAVSRAVRTPSRFDRDLFIPGVPPFLLVGGDFQSEISYVYELGYRSQETKRFSWSATAFYHDLESQRTITPGPGGATVANGREGHEAGIETWGTYRAMDWWRLWMGYTYLEKTLTVRPGQVDLQPEANIASDPKQWAKVRSAFDIGKSVEIDVMVRYYDALDNIDVPSYVALDARVGWNIGKHVELSLLLQNLTDPAHVEWAPGSEWERAAFLKALIRF